MFVKLPPKTLSPEARGWWRRLCREYGIEDAGGCLLLQTALESLDRLREAQKSIAKDGAVTTDRFGQQKAHPLLAAERDARAQMLMALKQLNLDVEPLRDRPGRPGKGSA